MGTTSGRMRTSYLWLAEYRLTDGDGRTDGWRPPLSVKGAEMGIWQRKGGYRLSGSGCQRDHATSFIYVHSKGKDATASK